MLQSRGPKLHELESRFIQLLAGREATGEIEARCFCETLPIYAISGKLLGLVVPNNSAAPPVYENSINVDADHVKMTKFASSDIQASKNVRDELKRMIRLAKERAAGAQDSAEQDDDRTSHVGNNTGGTMAVYGSSNISSRGSSGGSIHYGNVNHF